ncbi:ubiquitin carboxyl-terminal hydrolase 16-like [Actinidia eriantha]|uniref:ubiquitin carboxyl-terminal hydrolase 16-like n=1 Tax=Actinidia eriantha TaxID=165200 RepID=UPI00258BF3EC|nr:ubiquitin carboxyl-terminal hydrolase 16-like [Actinidia eriantha]
MPVGGDLGFSYLVLVVLFVGPVVGLVVRRKWRISVARSEEVKRLLVLASEEAARAELEATFGYDSQQEIISRPLQNQCAVCFCPTTKLCARCKAVRYCSGKCQIIHWRQGHKDECRPFTVSDQTNDAKGGSSQKVLKQEEYEIDRNSFETGGRQFVKSVQNLPEKPAGLNSDFSPEPFCGCPTDGKDTNPTSRETERSDRHQSTNIFPDTLETSCVDNVDGNGPLSSKRTVLVDSIDCVTSSSKLNQTKSDCINHDDQSGSISSSSGWSADGSTDSSFSDPSTPSSGFWEGSITSRRPKVDVLGDSAQSSSSGPGDAYLHNSGSSLSFSFKFHGNVVPPVVEQVSDPKTVTSDEHHSTKLGIKKSIDEAVLSKEISEDASKGRSSPLLSSEKSDHMDVRPSSDSPVSKSRESRYSSSSTCAYTTSSVGGPLVSTHAPKVSSISSMSSERSNRMVDDTSIISHPVASKEGESLSSSAYAAHLSSNTRRHSLQHVNPRKVENAHAINTTSERANAKNGLKMSMRKTVDQLRVSKPSLHHQSEVGSEITGRYSNKGLFPYELFVKLYNWNKIELPPFGLTNCGNSCYANAVLQCLACTQPLSSYLLQGLHSKACARKEWCFTCEFEGLIMKAKKGTSPLSPIGILSQIQNIGSHLGNGREEDAHEFLRYAIDTMQSACLKEAGVNASTSLEEETTLIGLTFGGYLRSKIKCMKCGGKSERHERMMDLTVEIDGEIGNLEEALRKFTGTEILDGENKYQCSRCKSYEKAKKKLTVLEAPNILTIALKRFQSGKFGKLNKLIQFPEILDLAPYMSRTSDNSPVYRLYGVVVHLDVMNAAFSGHYVCYVKNVQKKWFKIDDSTVKAVELENVLTKRAYMLLYARCSPRAPRLIRDSIVPRDPRKAKNPMFKPRSHLTGPWGASIGDPLNGYEGIESFKPIQRVLEDDSSSENSSSLFSEERSCSSESSNRDSSSADDYDHFFGDSGQNWNRPWKNTPDSDSSSSSSSSSPSPLSSKHSPLSNSDRYSSTITSQIRKSETKMDGDGIWTGQPKSSNLESKVSIPFLSSDKTKQYRSLESSRSRRATDFDRLGRCNPKSDVLSRKSSGERTD